MLDSSKLRHRVGIQQDNGSTFDDFGQPIDQWANIATRWARIEPLGGKELVDAQAIHADTSHRITLRYFDGLNTKHRITFNGRTFELVSVTTPDEIKESMIVLAVERTT